MRSKIDETNERMDIFQALCLQNVKSGAVGCWVKLLILYGYDEIFSSLPRLAQATGENENTFRFYSVHLRKRNMLKTERLTVEGFRGVKGVVMQLLPPTKWSVPSQYLTNQEKK